MAKTTKEAALNVSVDRAWAALRYAESMTLVLQSYLTSEEAKEHPINDQIMHTYCCALLDQITDAKGALEKITSVEVSHG
jgi:hypothetical protein